jgi:osmoprotectant transport system permease protein
LGGLGRYLIDGIKVRQFHIALVGALMVAALALLLDAALGFAIWASVPGTGRLRRMPVDAKVDRHGHAALHSVPTNEGNSEAEPVRPQDENG